MSNVWPGASIAPKKETIAQIVMPAAVENIQPPAGYEVISVAPPTGDPGVGAGGRVVVGVKTPLQSKTMWASWISLFIAIVDGIYQVLTPYLNDTKLDWNELALPLFMAAYAAFVAWRRKTENTIIGAKQ